MAFTYTDSPSTNVRDEVRSLIADDVQKPYSLTDAQIDYAIGQWSASPPVIGTNYQAAKVCAEMILGKLKLVAVSKRVGALSLTPNFAMFQFYKDLIRELANKATLQAVPMSIGGTSLSEKEAMNEDPDRVLPAFQVDGMSNTLPINQILPSQGI